MGVLDAPGLSRRDLTVARIRTVPTNVLSLPQTAAAPPTYTRGVANAATTISGGVLTAASQADAFTDMGASSQADVNGFYLSNNNGQSVTSTAGANPWAREWYTDAPALEIRLKGSGGPYRLAYNDGSGWVYASAAVADPGGSSVYLDLYDFEGVSRVRHYRLEMAGTFKFGGVYTGPTYILQRAPHDDPFLVLGDSFTEPTIQDSTGGLVLTGHEGYGMLLGRMLGYRNVWLSGSGGTGYLNPGSGGRVKFRDRVIADLIDKNPQRWIIAGGLNDANREPTYTAQMVYDEAVILFAQIKAALPYSEGGVLSPFCSSFPNPSLIGCRDALASAASACSLSYYDVLGTVPPSQRVSTTLTTAITGTTSSIAVAASIPFGTYIQVGTPAWGATPGSSPTRQIVGISGSGPYTLNLASAITGVTFPIGTAVTGYGFPWTTGSGRQSSTTGSGTGDRFIGADATHPTVAGHAALSRVCLTAILQGAAH